MKADLYTMLGECLIIPYSREIAERLEELCDEYAKEQNTDDDMVAEWAISLFARIKDTGIKQYLETMYNEKFGESISLPSSTMNALRAYLICNAIDGKYKSADSEYCSMSLMNCVILLNGRLASMPYADYFVERFGKLQKYIQQKSDDLGIETADLARSLFESSESDVVELDGNKIVACKKMAWESWKYNVIQMLEDKYSNEHCSYPDIYHALYEVIGKMPHEYLSLDLNYVLTNLIGYDSNEKNIVDIVKELEDNGCPFAQSVSKSSILLRLLNQDEDLLDLPFVKTPLSKHDFGVYLFYELLMEKIAGNYGTEE